MGGTNSAASPSCAPNAGPFAQVISEELGMKLENVDLSQLGRAKKVSVSKVRGCYTAVDSLHSLQG